MFCLLDDDDHENEDGNHDHNRDGADFALNRAGAATTPMSIPTED
jgi:hypothetical protein